jgi:hypothetical protein
MNLRGILRRVSRLETAAPLAAQYSIPKGSGMLGLRTAIEAARAARQNAPPSLPVGDMPNAPLTPVARLRADILAERKRRAELFAITPIEKLCEEPAIVDEIEDPNRRAVPMTPNPETSNE